MSIVQNPLFTGADPFLLCHEGVYYMYFTGGTEENRPGFMVYSSTDLQNWENRGYCLEAKDVMGDRGFWAPELLVRDGKFYMVYVANEHLGIAVADSPLGPFTQTEKRWISERNAIDGHFLVGDDGQVYLYYVRFDNANIIYAAKMSEDLMHIDEENEVRLIDAEEPWETRDCRVAEGAFVLKHNGLYYLTYSCNHTRSQDYAVGYAVSEHPLGPFVKYKGNPILHKTETVVGVGHHSFATAADGKTLLCAYHSHWSKEQAFPRRVCIDTAEFIQKDGEADILVIHGPSAQK